MRIGFVTGEYPPLQGGVGAFTHELARALVEQHHAIYVLTDHRVPSGSVDAIHVEGRVQGWNRASLFAVRHWAQVNRLDVVNLQYEAAAFQMAQLVHLMPRLLGAIPTITTFHDLLVPYLFPKAGSLRFRALLALARASDGVIVTNAPDEQRLRAEGELKRLCNIPIGSNIAVDLPPGYDRAAWRAKLRIPTEATLVGYFGFINASKGVDTLLEALAQVTNTHLLMIGGRTGSSDPTNQQAADEIDRLIAGLGLQSRVQWVGFVEGQQVSANLIACDMLALPYRDGVSLRRGSFMAALAHSCAIITTHPDGDLPEVQDRVQALLVPPNSPQALAAAIRELAADPALRESLQTNAGILAERFTWDHIAAQTAAFYRDSIGA
ncbi:MAG: glycosyltransferase family 4 protein [Chloroflexota bacterium]